MGNLRQKYDDAEWDELVEKSKEPSQTNQQYSSSSGTMGGVFDYNYIQSFVGTISKYNEDANTIEIKINEDTSPEILTLTTKELNDLIKIGKLELK